MRTLKGSPNDSCARLRGALHPTLLQVGSSVFSTLYVKVLGGVPLKQRTVVSSRTYWTAVMPIGLCMAAAFTTGNAAYMYLSGVRMLLVSGPRLLA